MIYNNEKHSWSNSFTEFVLDCETSVAGQTSASVVEGLAEDVGLDTLVIFQVESTVTFCAFFSTCVISHTVFDVGRTGNGRYVAWQFILADLVSFIALVTNSSVEVEDLAVGVNFLASIVGVKVVSFQTFGTDIVAIFFWANCCVRGQTKSTSIIQGKSDVTWGAVSVEGVESFARIADHDAFHIDIKISPFCAFYTHSHQFFSTVLLGEINNILFQAGSLIKFITWIAFCANFILKIECFAVRINLNTLVIAIEIISFWASGAFSIIIELFTSGVKRRSFFVESAHSGYQSKSAVATSACFGWNIKIFAEGVNLNASVVRTKIEIFWAFGAFSIFESLAVSIDTWHQTSTISHRVSRETSQTFSIGTVEGLATRVSPDTNVHIHIVIRSAFDTDRTIEFWASYHGSNIRNDTSFFDQTITGVAFFAFQHDGIPGLAKRINHFTYSFQQVEPFWASIAHSICYLSAVGITRSAIRNADDLKQHKSIIATCASSCNFVITIAGVTDRLTYTLIVFPETIGTFVTFDAIWGQVFAAEVSDHDLGADHSQQNSQDNKLHLLIIFNWYDRANLKPRIIKNGFESLTFPNTREVVFSNSGVFFEMLCEIVSICWALGRSFFQLIRRGKIR